MTKINYFSLGGQDEKDKYCGVLEINNEIFILNAGVGSDLSNQYGVRKAIPDLNYLFENKDKIKGIFIGTPKNLNIGALPFIIKELNNVPIYTSEIGKTIIEMWFQRRSKSELFLKNKQIKPQIIVVKSINDFKCGKTTICAIKTTTSMPDSYAWVFKLPTGSVVFVDEFVVANDRVIGYENELQVISQQTKNKVALLIVGTQAVGRIPGFANPLYKNFSFLKKTISNSLNRVVIGCYDNEIETIKNVIEISRIYNLKIVVYSNTFKKVLRRMIELKYINSQNLKLTDIEKLDPKDKDVIILIPGNQERLYYKLHKILCNEDKNLTFNEDDLFVLATVTRPGLELQEARLLDEVGRTNAETIKMGRNIIFTEACNEDHKYLLNILRPMYVVPVNGYYRDIINYINNAKNVINQNSIKILYNGEVLALDNNKRMPAKSVSVGEQYINEYGILDIGTSILTERASMTTSGLVIIKTLFNKKKQEFAIPQINTIGIYASDHERKKELENMLSKVVEKEIIKSLEKDNEASHKNLKMQLKKTVTRFFERQLQKKPLVVSLIGSIDSAV